WLRLLHSAPFCEDPGRERTHHLPSPRRAQVPAPGGCLVRGEERTMKRALGPLVLIGAAVLIRSACDDRLSVRGAVLDPEGQPVAGAVIMATYPRRMHEEKKRVKV